MLEATSTSDGAKLVFHRTKPSLIAKTIKKAIQHLGIALIPFLAIFGYASWHTGSAEFAFPWLRGELLVFSPMVFDLGRVKPSSTIEQRIRVANISAEQRSLIGCSKQCNCITLDTFPITLRPHSEQSVRVRVRLPEVPGPYSVAFKLFTDSPDKTSSEFVVSGIVE
jgi:hypothetical protein